MRSRSFLLFLAAGVSAFALACDQRPADPTLPTADITWQPIQRFSYTLSTRSIWASSDVDIYAGSPSLECGYDVCVGAEPEIQHFDGNAWSKVDLPIKDENGSTSLWGTAANNVYIAVQHLYHFDGASWTQEPIDASTVTGSAADNVFASDRQSVFHFNSSSWDTLMTMSNKDIGALSASVDGSLWVSTYDSVLVWNHSAWSSVHWPPTYGLGDLVALSSNTALALRPSGDFYYPPFTDIYRWDGMQWAVDVTFPFILETLWCDGPSDVYSVGESGHVVHYDGQSWSELARPTSFGLRVVHQTPMGQLLVAGWGGKIAELDGQQWRTLREGLFAEPGLLWAESATHFFASSGSLVFERSDDRWSENVLPIRASVLAFAGLTHNDLFASVDNKAILHYDGSSWTVAIDSLVGNQSGMYALPSGTILTSGRDRVYRFDGSWQAILEGEFMLNSITGDESGDILVGGRGPNGPLVKYFNGSSWRSLSFPFGRPAGVCIGPDKGLYVAGNAGLYRWDGAQFAQLLPPGAFYFDRIFGVDQRVLAFGYDNVAVYEHGIANVQQQGGALNVTRMENGNFIAFTGPGIGVWKP